MAKITPAPTTTPISVKQYGALGNGTTDDSAAFQRAINAAATSGLNYVYIPAGNYVVGGITCTDKLKLEGVGSASILQHKAGALYLIAANPGSAGTTDPANNMKGLRFSSLRMVGNSTSNIASYEEHTHLSVLSAVTDVEYRDVSFSAWQGDAVYIGSGTVPGVERHNQNIRFYGCDFDGVYYNNRNCISVIDVDGFYTDPACTFKRSTTVGNPGAIDFEPDYQVGGDGKVFGIIRNVDVNGSFVDVPNGTAVGFLLPPQGLMRVPAQNFRVKIKVDGCKTGFGISAINVDTSGATRPAITATTPPHSALFDVQVSKCNRPFAFDAAVGVKAIGQISDCLNAAYLGYTVAIPCRDIELDFKWRGIATATNNALEIRTVSHLVLKGHSEDAKGRFMQFKTSTGTPDNSGDNIDNRMTFSSPQGLTSYVNSIEGGYTLDYGSCRELGARYEASFGNDFMVDGSSRATFPTTGTWPLGAFIKNNNPIENGASPYRYVLNGWECVVAGTPGTWRPLYRATDAPSASLASLFAYDTTTLPEVFPLGSSVWSANGDTALPDTSKQGVLLTHRGNLSVGFDSFVTQHFYPANNTVMPNGFFTRTGATGNVWTAWRRVLTTLDVGTTVVSGKMGAASGAPILSSALPESYPVGLTVSSVNGDGGVPLGTQGILTTTRADTLTAYDNFITQTFHPANANANALGKFFVRRGATANDNTWGSWQEFRSASIVPRPPVTIAAASDLNSSAVYANQFGVGLSYVPINGGTNVPGVSALGVLTTLIDPTYGADGIGFSYQIFTARGPTGGGYIRFGGNSAGAAWGAWQRLGVVVQTGPSTLASAPTAADFNGLVALLKSSGVLI